MSATQDMLRCCTGCPRVVAQPLLSRMISVSSCAFIPFHLVLLIVVPPHVCLVSDHGDDVRVVVPFVGQAYMVASVAVSAEGVVARLSPWALRGTWTTALCLPGQWLTCCPID